MSDLRARQQSAEMVSLNVTRESTTSSTANKMMNGQSSGEIHGDDFEAKNQSSHFDESEIQIQENLSNIDLNSPSVSKDHSATYVRLFGKSFNKIFIVTHINIFLYAACFWIQQAVFPYLSKHLGADPVTFGYLQTTFAIVQLTGGPLFGRFGDMFGSRLAMLSAFVACTSSYFLLYMATTIPLLFLSRLPSVFMHAVQGGQMILTDVCDTKERANVIAKLGLSYGMGMVAGTLMGGVIAKLFSLETGALVACFGSMLSLLSIYIYIPAKVKKTLPTSGQQQESIFSISKIVRLLKSPGAFFLMSIKIGTGIPIGIFQSMFSIIALETFKLPPDQNSYMMSYIGVLSMFYQGFLVNLATKRFSDLSILTGSAALLSVSYLALSLVSNVWQMCVVFLPLVAGLTFQTVITTSALTNTVSNADTGAMLGMSMAVNSLIRSVSPTAGGYMLRSLGFPSFGYLGFVTTSIVTVILLLKLRRERL